MKNKALVSLLLLTFVTAGAAFAPRVFAQSPTLDKLTFTAKSASGKNYNEVKAVNTSISGAVVIPGTYNNIPVTNIPQNAFYNCSNITSVTIPASATSVGTSAFRSCTNLTSVTFGGSSTTIQNESGAYTSFPGDLAVAYKANGAGTYTRPTGGTNWTKQGSASAPAQTTPAQTAQGQGKYYLEIYDISQATINTLDRMLNDSTTVKEDLYYTARTASGTALRNKDKDLTLEQVRQKLISVAPQITSLNEIILLAQQKWGVNGISGSTNYRIYYWIRRSE